MALVLLVSCFCSSNAVAGGFDNKTWTQPDYQALQDFYRTIPGFSVDSYAYRPDGSGICLRDDRNNILVGNICDEIVSYPGSSWNTYNSYSNLPWDGSNAISPNLINPNNWTGNIVYGEDPGGCCASISGSGALFDTLTNQIMFSYGTSVVAQTIAINEVLKATGLTVDGFAYAWQFRKVSNNGRGDDQLEFSVTVKDTNGGVVEEYVWNRSGAEWEHDKWYAEGGIEIFNPVTNPGNVNFSIMGRDGGFWAGYYGPEVKDVNLQLIYRANPCASDPLFDTSCPGYAEAYAQQQYELSCQANPLYDIGCAGYEQAYFTQQCNADALYSSACPGYAEAYFNQQCSIDPLYDSTCSGYETAYYNQQCSINPLYDVGCDGYQEAYVLQQCKSNSLYDVSCPGYAEAYYDQQCSIDALYDTGCPGYETAYYDKQCSINTLYDSGCPGYETAYFDLQCSINTLYDSGCPGYETAYYNQQCSINALYDTGCPGYETAYYNQQCSLNPLYDTGCNGYADAYFTQQCNADPLYDAQCPGYQTAYYNQQCGLDPLYDAGCPGYEQAYYETYVKPAEEALAQQQAEQQTTTTTTASVSPSTSSTGDAVVDDVINTTKDTTSATSPLSQVPGVSVLAPTPNTTTAPIVEARTEEQPEVTEQQQTEEQVEAELVASLEANDEREEQPSSDVGEQVEEGGDKEGSEGEPGSDRSPGDGGNGNSESRESAGKRDAPSATQKAEARRKKIKEIAVAKAKELANDLSKAATAEAQRAIQAQVLALINFNPDFAAYAQMGLSEIDFYGTTQMPDGEIDKNTRGLRNGLAQQLLHQQMVDMQYGDMK